jgi:hypothetical protein
LTRSGETALAFGFDARCCDQSDGRRVVARLLRDCGKAWVPVIFWF